MVLLNENLQRPGFYVSLIGPEGGGKTTHCQRLTEDLADLLPGAKVLHAREPGGLKAAEKIRELALGEVPDDPIEAETRVYLFGAARAQSLRTLVRPILELGGIVIGDRCFLDSLAHQGVGMGLGIEAVYWTNMLALGDLKPDAAILVDVPVEVSRKRNAGLPGKKDAFEQMSDDYHLKVRDGYLQLAEKEPRIKVVDGNRPLDVVYEEIFYLILQEVFSKGYAVC